MPKQEWRIWKILKSFLNHVFNPVSDLDNNPFQNHPKMDKYEFVSREERCDELKRLQLKYPTFRRVYTIHKWIELWNTINFEDAKHRELFLKHFESAIKEFDGNWRSK